MSDKKIQFRKSMGGYNREDVNGYIEAMNSRHYEAESGYRKKITELEEKIKQLEEKNRQYEEKGLTEVEQLRAGKEQSDRLIVELNGTTEKLQGEKEELVQENAKLKERVQELERVSENNSEVYEKSNKYDQVSGQIGSVLLNANARAESIVNEAQLKARLHMSSMIDTAMEKLQQINEKYAKEITSKTVQMTEELRALSLSADTFRTNTQSALENECRELKESLEATKKIVLEGNDE